jgi:hypothetical protein
MQTKAKRKNVQKVKPAAVNQQNHVTKTQNHVLKTKLKQLKSNSAIENY